MVLQALGQVLPADGTAAKEAIRQYVRRDPLEANLSFILGATALFYLAEKDENPKVETYIDALVYVTTCMSVGYADTFARTQTGKLIGSVVMTIGPALSGTIFDSPASAPDPNAQIQAAILDKLDAILGELRRKG